MTTGSTEQTNRLRALLLSGDDADRQRGRGALTEACPAGLTQRRPPRGAGREQSVRHAEIRRQAARELKTNRVQLLQSIINDIA